MPDVRISERAYPHRRGFRYRLSAGPGQIKWGPVGRTAEEARELAQDQIGAYQAHLGVTVGDLIERYVQHLQVNDRRVSTVLSARKKLQMLLRPMRSAEVINISPARAKAHYLELVPTCAAATHHVALKRARSAWRWAVSERLARINPWEGVALVGRQKRGKLQLRIDETNKLIAACLKDVDSSDGALAVLILIFCGVRSSEVRQRAVRDIDVGGTRLVIPSSKSEAGQRAPELPAVIQPAVRLRTQGRSPTEPLLRNAHGKTPSAYWLAASVELYCKQAGVPVVCPHALRGGWATIAYSAGALSHTVAAALGHASPAVTEAHYAKPEAVADAQQARRLQFLKGGKA